MRGAAAAAACVHATVQYTHYDHSSEKEPNPPSAVALQFGFRKASRSSDTSNVLPQFSWERTLLSSCEANEHYRQDLAETGEK